MGTGVIPEKYANVIQVTESLSRGSDHTPDVEGVEDQEIKAPQVIDSRTPRMMFSYVVTEKAPHR